MSKIDLELERKKLELMRVETAKHDMLFQIMQRQADIDRLKEQVDIQEKKIEEIKLEIGVK